MTSSAPDNKLSGQQIDAILDEIDQNERKVSDEIKTTESANWNEILTEIRAGNVNFIKNLVSSNDIQINTRNPLNGMTLLQYAVIIGNIDLVKAICNFGGDPHIKDNRNLDALDYARRYGMYRITELLYYQQLSGSLGQDMKDIASAIHQKTKEADLITKPLKQEMLKFMQNAVKNRMEFSPDLLYYTVYWTVTEIDTGYYAKPALEKPFWEQMMKTYNEILTNTKDKSGWEWLKAHFINSLIWYLPHPQNKPQKNDETRENKDDDGDMMEGVLKQTLFYELLFRVREESKRQSDQLLRDRINAIKKEKATDWNDLVSYNVKTKWSSNARQDVCLCLVPKYNKQDLNEKRFPPSTHFSAQKHYDKYIYLNELLFTANILNKTFQNDMKYITRKIAAESNGTIRAIYRAGPVKTLQRSQTKVENDYIQEDYPTSAKILDINRCALQFENIREMMKFIEIFTKTIEEGNAKSIDCIIRCKNGWSIYNTEYPTYTDVKLNVLVKTSEGSIIAEIQFLLHLMSAFKKKAHKLYGIERKFEMVYNYGLLQQKMTDFDDNINAVKNLADNDDLEYLKTYLNTVNIDNNTLIGFKLGDNENVQLKETGQLCSVWSSGLINIMLNDGKINKYLKSTLPDLYYNSIRHYFIEYMKETKYGEGAWKHQREPKEYLEFVAVLTDKFKAEGTKKKEEILTKLISNICDSAQHDGNKLMKLLMHRDERGKALFDRINQIAPFNMLLNTPFITDKDKTQLIMSRLGVSYGYKGRYKAVLETIKYLQNDAALLSKVLLNCTILVYECKWGEFELTQVLGLIFRSRTLSSAMKVKALTHQSGSLRSPIDMIIGVETSDGWNHSRTQEGHTIMPILRNLDKNELIKVLKFHIDKGTFCYYTNHCAILAILRHFIRDRKRLNWLLSQAYKKNGKRVFDRICEENNSGELMKCILFESVLTKEDVDELLFGNVIDTKDTKIFKFYVLDKEEPTLSANALSLSNIEIIRYLCDDKERLLRLLTFNIYNGITYFMWLCSDRDGAFSTNQEGLKFIFTQTVLDVNDIFGLFYNYKDNESKNAWYYALDADNDSEYAAYSVSYNIMQVIDYFVDYPDLLKQIMLQPSMHDKSGIMHCSKDGILEHALTAIADYPFIIKNIDGIQFANTNDNIEESRDTFVKESRSVQRLVTSMKEEKEIDLLSKEYEKTKPLMTALNMKKYEIIEEYIVKHIGKNARKYVQVLSKMVEYGTCLMHYIMNDDIRLLRSLLLNNSNISDEIKCKLLIMHKDTKDTLIGGVEVDVSWFPDAAFVSDDVGEKQFEILKYFADKKDVKSLESLVSIPHQDRYSSLAMLKSIEALKIVLYSSGIDKALLIGLLQQILLGYDTFIHQKGFVFEIFKWLKNDRNGLLSLLSETLDDGRSALGFIVKNECPGRSLDLLLNDSHLNDDDKKKLLLSTSERDEDILFKACDMSSSYNGSNVDNAIAIWNYFIHKNEIKILKNSLNAVNPATKMTLIMCAAAQDNAVLIGDILSFIEDNLDYEEQLCVLLRKDKEIYKKSNFMWKILKYKNLKIVFEKMNNNGVIKQCLEQIGGYYGTKTLYEQYRNHDNYGSKIDDRYKGEQLIYEWMDYAKMVDSLENNIEYEYNTNPFITSCYLGKRLIIFKLLNSLNVLKLESLLLNSLNHDNGNNCLLELCENGFHQIMLAILQFLDKQNLQNIKEKLLFYQNVYTKQSIFMILSKNDVYIDIIQKILQKISNKDAVANLLNQKDIDNKTCLDHSTPNIIKQFAKYN